MPQQKPQQRGLVFSFNRDKNTSGLSLEINIGCWCIQTFVGEKFAKRGCDFLEKMFICNEVFLYSEAREVRAQF